MPPPTQIQSFVIEDTRQFDAGTYEGARFVIPDGVDNLRLKMDRAGIPAIAGEKSVVRMQAWISYDGGRKFDLLIGCTTAGGDVIDPVTGLATTETTISRHIKPKYKTNDRVLIVRMQCRVALTTKITVEFW